MRPAPWYKAAGAGEQLPDTVGHFGFLEAGDILRRNRAERREVLALAGTSRAKATWSAGRQLCVW